MATSIGFDVVAHDRASRTLDNVGRSADRSGSKWKTLGKAVKFAAVGIAAGVGVAAVAALKFAKGAAEDEQAAGRLAVALRKNAGATKSQVSATEDWISKQGVALGVTDDELRPALGRLVTSTHDVGKAQKLTSLAMDVSAGTGKSLESVSTALMKANNGQVSALSRLGVNTKNARGETISMEQATRRLADTFGGQAAKAADTTQGKYDRLRLILSETGETIGYKLLPPLTAVATWFLSKGVPALSRFSSQFQSVLVPSLRSTGSFITGSVIPAVAAMVPVLLRVASAVGSMAGFFARHRTTLAALLGTIAAVVAITKVHTAVMAVQAAGGLLPMLRATKLVTAATRAYAAVQWVLNAAMRANPIGIVITVLALLAAAVVVAYRKSDTFRAIVNRAFAAAKSGASAMWAVARTVFAAMGKAMQAVGKAGMWLWNNALRPAFSFIGRGIGTVMGAWAAMLRALGRVPGFGWAKTAAAVMQSAADKATNLASSIGRIQSKTVQVTVQYSYKGLKSPTRGPEAFTYARGTSYHPGGLAVVGEEGPELLDLPRGSKVTPAGETAALRMFGRGDRRAAAGSATEVIEVHNHIHLEGGTIVESVKRYKRVRNGGRELGIA